MGLDMQISQVRTARHIDRTREAALLTAMFSDQISDRGTAGRIALESFTDRRAEQIGAVVIKQFQKLDGLTSDGFSALESRIEQRFTFRNRQTEPAAGRGAQGAALLFEQGLAVLGIFDDLVAVPAAPVPHQFGDPIENAYPFR